MKRLRCKLCGEWFQPEHHKQHICVPCITELDDLLESKRRGLEGDSVRPDAPEAIP